MHRRQEIRVPSLCPPVSHYVDAVSCNGLLFISGIVACDSKGQPLFAGDVVGQATKVFENMREILKAASLTPADVVKVTVYLTDISHREAINPVRQAFFGATRPASTLVEVSALIYPELLVEIDAVAVASE